MAKPSLSTVLFRVVDDSAIDSEVDDLNRTLRLEALLRGIAVLGETVVGGKTALKFTILNPCLTLADFERLLEKINTLAVELINKR